MYELNTIYKGDSIQLIKGIDDNAIDLIISDIPYGIGVDTWDVLHTNTNNAYLGSSPAQEKLEQYSGKEVNHFMVGRKPINLSRNNIMIGL